MRRLIVADHAFWLDIPALGSIEPMTFLAKREIGASALGGRLARWSRFEAARRAALSPRGGDAVIRPVFLGYSCMAGMPLGSKAIAQATERRVRDVARRAREAKSAILAAPGSS